MTLAEVQRLVAAICTITLLHDCDLLLDTRICPCFSEAVLDLHEELLHCQLLAIFLIYSATLSMNVLVTLIGIGFCRAITL